MLCECGCGQTVKLGNRFINYHQTRGRHNPNYGKSRSPETRRKISKAMKGKRFSAQHRKNISTSHKGLMVGQRNPNYGNHPSAETKKAMSPWKGKKFSIKHRKRMAEAKRGENNPQWRGGKSFEPYSPGFNDDLKRKIKERDGHKCQFPYCQRTTTLTIHHIDYDKKNSAESNLITLCNRHNTKVNANRDSWTNYFTSMLTEDKQK